MNKIILLVLCLSLSLSTLAQEKAKKTAEQKARANTTEMTTYLKLSKEQETMVYSSELKYYQSTDAYEATHKKKEEKKFKAQAQANRNKDYKRILTPAQYKQYLAKEKAEDLQKEKEKLLKKQAEMKEAALQKANKKK